MQTKEQQESLEQSQAVSNDMSIDLGNYGAACETISIDSLLPDTITLGPTINYTGSSTASYSNTVISGIGTGYNNWTTGTNCYTFTNTAAPNTVYINNTGIEMAAGTDLKIDGKSLKEFMTKMEQRLSILVPDPAKLEKFEALKRAYEHYKTMEALCFPDEKDTKNEC